VERPHDVSSDAFRVSDRRARPSPEALSWAVSSLGDGGRLVSVRPLVGGISSAVHGLVIEHRRSGRSRVVMRRWLEPETESLVRREAAALTGLAATGIPAPALVAADPSGDNAGCPALLMEWLPGQVDLAPRAPQRWLGALAHVGAQIHEAQIEVPPYEDGINLSGLASNSFAWSTRPDAWKHARGLLSGETAPSNDVFLHADFQHFNALWSRRQLSGIVDWTFAAIGPRELDTGRCRLNLAVLFSVEWAETFRHAYEAEAGVVLDPWWELRSLASYGPDWQSFIPLQVGDRARVDVAGMHARVDALLMSILQRM
jgi:aminoglycoside phosphotransferase (APT) family kinase protein